MGLQPFQLSAVAELSDIINDSITRRRNSNEKSLFHSPTGSGKTTMVAEAIKRHIDSSVLFVWISIAVGNNAEQSYDAFKTKYNFDESNIYCFDSLSSAIPTQAKIIFCNWTFLKTPTGDSKTPNYEKKVAGGGESFIEHIKAHGKVVLLIDEAHHTSKSEKSKEIIDLIGPWLTVEISATPSQDDVHYNSTVRPDILEVKKSGLLKQGIVINHCEDGKVFDDEDLYLLESAETVRKDIESQYKQIGADILPLVIVKSSSNKKDGVRSKLNGLGVLDEEIAEWFCDEKINLPGITEPNNPIKYLIFNQSIVTGWDCPRAHIIVQLMPIGKENTLTQLIGRILRTVEHRIYDIPILDNGYVFTLSSNIGTDAELLSQILTHQDSPEGKIAPAQYDIVANEDRLKEINGVIGSNKILTSKINITTLAEKVADSELVAGLKKEYLKTVKPSLEGVSDGFKKEWLSVEMDAIEQNKIEHLSTQIETTQDVFANDMCKKYGISKLLRCVFLDSITTLTEEHFIALGIFIKENSKKEVIDGPFELKPSYKLAWEESYSRTYKKNIYSTAKGVNKGTFEQSLSGPEKYFIEEYLEKDETIKSWVKNFDSGNNALSYPYEVGGNLHLHNPDFICLTVEGKIKLFETKELTDTETLKPANLGKHRHMKDIADSKEWTYDLIFVDVKAEKMTRLLNGGGTQPFPQA